MTELTERDKAMLTLAFGRYKHAGRLEADVREKFDISSARFWQRVGWLLEQPEAEAWEPVETRRLLRLRDARRAARTSAPQ